MPFNCKQVLTRVCGLAGVVAVAMLLASGIAEAQRCGNNGAGFEGWVRDFRAAAARQGISQRAISAGLDGVSYDQNIIRLDRNQRSFRLSFEEFYRRRVSSSLLSRGRQLMQTHSGLLSRIERQYGVPPAIIISIWGLETNFGRDGAGGRSIPRSLATLAYDCRRSEFFTNELMNALRIIDRGDMTPAQLVGGWAGEIGPMQFLPSSYVRYAVDFDGDGRRNLMTSIPDMLASTANYLKVRGGWQAGQGWQPGSRNYNAIREWNKAEVYVRTIATMADRLASR